MLKFLVALTISTAAHAAPLALEGTYNFEIKHPLLLYTDENNGCPEKLVVKAEYDPASGKPLKLELWDAGKLAAGGAPEHTFYNRAPLDEEEDFPGVKYYQYESISDTYAFADNGETLLGIPRSETGKQFVELQHKWGGDELVFHIGRRCYFTREKVAK